MQRLVRSSLQEPSGNDRFLALDDVSMEMKRGDTVGIIGRNGAGKSTLLKILSRVTAPTRGVIRLNGRVASLLEVGTGFHPELTGRENVFINGAVLGMNRAQESLQQAIETNNQVRSSLPITGLSGIRFRR